MSCARKSRSKGLLSRGSKTNQCVPVRNEGKRGIFECDEGHLEVKALDSSGQQGNSVAHLGSAFWEQCYAAEHCPDKCLLLLHQYEACWLISNAGNMPNTADRLFHYETYPERTFLTEHKAGTNCNKRQHVKGWGSSHTFVDSSSHRPCALMLLSLAYVGCERGTATDILETFRWWLRHHLPDLWAFFKVNRREITIPCKHSISGETAFQGRGTKPSSFGFILKLQMFLVVTGTVHVFESFDNNI